MTDDVEKFKKKYRAHVQDGQRRYAVPKRLSMDPLSPSHEPFDLNFEYESGVQIDMTKRDFQTLVEMEKWFEDKIQQSYTKGNEAYAIYDEYQREVRIRNDNPAAKLAYEKYQNILRMIDSYYG